MALLTAASLRRLAPELAVVLLATWVAALVAPTRAAVDFAANADETHYLAYATEMQQRGLGGFRTLFRDYAASERRWFFPSPLRAAYIALAGAWTGIRGLDYRALSELSLACHLLSIAVAYLFARRLFGDPRALGVAALVAFSPLGLGLSRRALMDSTATLAAWLAIFAFWEAARRPESAPRRALFALALAAAVLVKETSVLLVVPFALYAAALRLRRGAAPGRAPLALAAAASLAACAGLWLFAAGDPATLWQVVRGIVASPAQNEYARLLGGGPWYRYLLDFALLSVWPTLLAVAALGALALRLRRGEWEAGPVYLALLLVGLLLAFGFFTKNVRYVALLELPIRGLAVWLVWELAPGRPALRHLAGGLLVALVCAADYATFRGLFLEYAVHDPMSAWLLSFRELLPAPAP